MSFPLRLIHAVAHAIAHATMHRLASNWDIYLGTQGRRAPHAYQRVDAPTRLIERQIGEDIFQLLSVSVVVIG